jgi:hypothetical protein
MGADLQRTKKTKQKEKCKLGETLDFNMGEATDNWMAADTDRGKWSASDQADGALAKDFLGVLKDSYSEDSLNNLGRMLATPIDDAGHGLGDSRLFIQAAARAARQFDNILRKREGGREGQRQLKFNMPVEAGERRALQREAQAILEREFMNARSEYIKRSGRPLPGWNTFWIR